MTQRVLRRPRGDAGTSTLEFAGILPVVAVVIVGLLQGGVALYAVGATETAARDAARAMSLGRDPAAAARAALPSWLPASLETFGPGHGVHVRVDLPDVVPGSDLVVRRSAVMP